MYCVCPVSYTHLDVYKRQALRDEHGNYRITGRVDDVLNVSGHRIGTAELENAVNMHPEVVESAIVGYHHDIKGQGVYAVSYTHLDVYKRQVEISIQFSFFFNLLPLTD